MLGQIGQTLDVLSDRRGEHHQIRVGHDHRVISRHVDGVSYHRQLEHRLVIDADDKPPRPELTRGQRNRAADQS